MVHFYQEKSKDYSIIRPSIKHIFQLAKFYSLLNREKQIRTFYSYLYSTDRLTFFKLYSRFVFFLYLPTIARLIKGKNLFALIAVEKQSGAILGICHIEVEYKTQIAYCSGELGIVVLGDFEGRGLGRVLIQSCFEMSKKRGLDSLYLKVDSDNYRAIDLYLNLGFKILKVVKNGDFRYTTGQKVDYLLMEILLKQGNMNST